MTFDFIALGEVADITKLAGFEFTKYIKYNNSGEIIALRALNLRHGELDLTDIKRIDKSVSEILPRSKLYSGDILLTYTGNGYGDCALISENDKYHLAPNVCKITPNIQKIDPYFLYSYVRSNEFYQQMSSHMVGSSQPTIPMKTIRTLEVPFPSLEKQTKIKTILYALDEKIRINRAINDNLEEQALTLFRQYFMDYVPYGGIAPSNWTEVSLDEVCTRITDGSHYSPADAPESPYPMYSVKDMETYGFNSSSCKHISEEDFRKMKKNDCIPLLNDILIAKDGSYLKEIFICSEEKDEAILSSIAIFRPDTNIIMPEILLYLLKQPSVRKDVGDNYVSGSALPRIVLKDFKKYRFMLPPMDEQLKIGSVLHTIRMQTKKNLDEIQCLLSARDTLLPRLMSGELDVSDLDL